MKNSKTLKIAVSLALPIICFGICLPLHFSMYIPMLHSVISIIIEGISSLIISRVIYLAINKSLASKDSLMLIYFLAVFGIGHGIYCVMFYTSMVYLALSIIAVVAILAAFLSKKCKK